MKRLTQHIKKLPIAGAMLMALNLGVSPSAHALEQSINIKKSDVRAAIISVLNNPKVRMNTYGPASYKGKSSGNSWYKGGDSYVIIAGKKTSIPIPEFVVKLYSKGGKKPWRIWKAYANDINLANFSVTTSSSASIGFKVELESANPEVKVKCLRRTASLKKHFHKGCVLKGLSPDVELNKTSLSFKVAPVVRNGSLSYGNVSNVKFNTDLKIGNLCKLAKSVCKKLEVHLEKYMTKQINQKVVSQINKSANKDKVANALRKVISAKLPKNVKWTITKLENKSTYYRLTIKTPIDKNSVAAATLQPTKKAYVSKCPTHIPLKASVFTGDKLKGKLWLVHKGGKKSKVLNWSIPKAGIKKTTSTIKRYYRLPTINKYGKKKTWSQLVVQWSDGKGKTFTRKSNKAYYYVTCKKPGGPGIKLK